MLLANATTIEIEEISHQLEVLGVLRPKLAAVRNASASTSAAEDVIEPASSSTTVAASADHLPASAEDHE
jgi:hypothetical protein